MPPPNTSAALTITAAHPDFFIGSTALDSWPPGPSTAGSDRLTIRLKKVPPVRDRGYTWVDPRPHEARSEQCGNCHAEIFEEWSRSAHASAATNLRFRNLYDGTNVRGESGHGWSLRGEHPHGQSVCWSCHVPSGDRLAFGNLDLPVGSTTEGQGVHCDFCHKIQCLQDGEIGLMHGRYAVQLLQPETGQVFFGPLDDVDRGDEVYSPLQSNSELCAICHEGVLFGVHVYRTYSEWLKSPARDRQQHCQDCHMQPTGLMTNMAPGMGGMDRDPHTLASHELRRGGRDERLRKTLEMTVSSQREQNAWRVDVSLLPRNVGHRLPTGYIDRQIVLDLLAYDEKGAVAPLIGGTKLSDVVGPPLSGRAGHLFARVLTDDENSSPAPFWRHTVMEVDQSLLPEQKWQATYRFPLTADHVQVTLSYRRFWKSVAVDKDWPDDTIVVHRRDLQFGTEHQQENSPVR
ncbi:MAG: multiheme c-type cytochrome [Planctomycetota bacterium]|nr:multiheme c-type cytochrome [Planctomycetota bacterium]MDA1177406.1 multiheme c-type cytochrome [Planctomycetota bacterium]